MNEKQFHQQQSLLKGNHLFQLASNLKTLLQQFYQKQTIPIQKFDQLMEDSLPSCPPDDKEWKKRQQDDDDNAENQSRKKQRIETFEEVEEEILPSVYETAVVKYRLLRNEIPLLTDAAVDIEAAILALHEKDGGNKSNSHSHLNDNNNDSLKMTSTSLGPYVKKAPPGRGRSKTLSVMNTPLPATILETLQKQKKYLSKKSSRGHTCGTKIASVDELIFPRPFRILFIDDSVITLKLTAKRLQKAGFFIETTTNGIDALNLIYGKSEEEDYDIILTDLNMPIMSGTEVSFSFSYSFDS